MASQDKGREPVPGGQPQSLEIVKEEGEVPLEHVNGQIELVEHTPETAAGPGDSGGTVGDDGHDWLPDGDHELKRVKVSGVCLASCLGKCGSGVSFGAETQRWH